MNVLVLGGTVFLGRHVVDELLGHGARVTTFTRGAHPEPALPSVTRLHGDRTAALDALPRDGWDAVIDTCGFVPRVVSASAEHLQAAGRYLFVSTISVYDTTQPAIDESSPLASPVPPTETVDAQSYGPLKVLCENAVADVFGARCAVVRPGLIVGPYDPTDRFTYWVERGARGGAMLLPAPPEAHVQFVDVRDVATFIVRALYAAYSGTYNVTSPPGTLTFATLPRPCRLAAAANARPVWVDPDFLESHGVEPWSDLPLWLPESLGERGMSNVSPHAPWDGRWACDPPARGNGARHAGVGPPPQRAHAQSRHQRPARNRIAGGVGRRSRHAARSAALCWRRWRSLRARALLAMRVRGSEGDTPGRIPESSCSATPTNRIVSIRSFRTTRLPTKSRRCCSRRSSATTATASFCRNSLPSFRATPTAASRATGARSRCTSGAA